MLLPPQVGAQDRDLVHNMQERVILPSMHNSNKGLFRMDTSLSSCKLEEN